MPKSFARHNPNRLKKCGLLTSLLSGMGIFIVSNVYSAPENSFDWVPYENLPEDKKAQVRPGCKGTYVDPLTEEKPEGALPDAGFPRVLEDIVVEADNAHVIDGNEARLTGDVTVTQGNTSLVAGSMSYDRIKDVAKLADGVKIRQPGLMITGDNAHVEFQQKRSRFEGAEFVLHDYKIRGSAKAIGQAADDTILLEEGQVTGCEPNNNGWSLEGEEISVNTRTQQGVGRNVKLKVADVPVLYLPYITFPVGTERQSGFLFPAVSTSENGGLDIAVPYYWNIAPNYDATITPRLITGRGAMLETEFRHLNRLANTEFSASILPDDDGGNNPNDDNASSGSSRWLASFQQYGGDTTGWYLKNDYTRVSDINYFRDIDSYSFTSSNNSHLNQIFHAGYQSNNWDMGALYEDHQLLVSGIDSQYVKEPQLNIDGFYHMGSFAAYLNHEVTDFSAKSEQPTLEGARVALSYQFNWHRYNQWGFVKPALGYKALFYELNVNDNTTPLDGEDQQHYDAFQGSFDTGLKFERSGTNFVQTLEPRLFYLYRQYVDQSDMFNVLGEQDINFDTFFRTFTYDQLFRDSRFIGSDRLDDANHFTLGLSSRFLDPTTSEEKMRVSLGKIYYVHDRRVILDGEADNQDDLALDSSELALETAFSVTQYTDFIINAIYDTRNRETNRSTVRFHYAKPDKTQIFNIGYNRNQTTISSGNLIEPLEQADVSGALQITPRWSMMARVNYDLENSRELESFAGFEYDDCCYRFRLLGRKWLQSNSATVDRSDNADFDQGIFLEIHLKGLGGSGAKINSILNEGIYGYEEREALRE